MSSCKKILVALFICNSGIILALYFDIVPTKLNLKGVSQFSSHVATSFKTYINSTKLVNERKKKKIVMVNTPSWFANTLDQHGNVFAQCDVSCEFRYKNGLKYANESDAVIFHAVDYNIRKNYLRKPVGQIWIFAVWESPAQCSANSFNNEKFKNMINWTMTYRLDSDIPVPYGLVRKKTNPTINYSKILAGKEKLMAQVVSHCPTMSKRAVYTKTLQTYLPLNIFGRCGPTGRRNNDVNLFRKIEKSYKFYLAFENSLCRDYITEKFFNWQNGSIVPIVRGGGNYELFYPKNSYIDVRDFKSISDLADYIKYLDRNNTAYIEYLKAKENYVLVGIDSHRRSSFCKICQMLQDPDKYKHVYKNVYDWYHSGDCKKPTDLEK